MHFSIWTMKQDRPDLYYKEIDESIINLNDFIKDADVIKEGSTAILAILFYYLDDTLRGDILLRIKPGNSFQIPKKS